MTYWDTISGLLNGTIKTSMNPVKRQYWPRFAFHFTDINNAVNILKRGLLVSRVYAEQHRIMINDNASNKVIRQTKPEIKKFVRLYFRPRTPTQYYNEGFQTKRARLERPFEANCPVPVFFLFDMSKLLKLPGTQFSNRSLALNEEVSLMSTAEEYGRLPFADIYHDDSLGGLTSSRKHEITEHKHAEIVVPDKLSLDLLRFIYVRSIAEKNTLLALLHDVNIYRYDGIIRVGDESTFYMDRNFIRDVNLSATTFSIKSRVKNPYPSEWGSSRYAVNSEATDRYLNVVIKSETPSGRIVVWPRDGYKALFKENMTFKLKRAETDYRLRVTIDNHIAYLGEYKQEADEPY